MKKCVFFDRDGIVNRVPEREYIERWEDFYLEPGFVAALEIVSEHNYEAVIVTNQRGVALGVMTREAVENIHDNLRAMLKDKYDLTLLDIFCCPHDNGECDCRKPKPGMLLQAAEKHGIDLKSSWMIGDNVTDIEAGRAAGCRTIYVGKDVSYTDADLQLTDMSELAELLDNVLQ